MEINIFLTDETRTWTTMGVYIIRNELSEVVLTALIPDSWFDKCMTMLIIRGFLKSGTVTKSLMVNCLKREKKKTYCLLAVFGTGYIKLLVIKYPKYEIEMRTQKHLCLENRTKKWKGTKPTVIRSTGVVCICLAVGVAARRTLSGLLST